jgi:alkylmercury lyase-like protein
MADQHAEASHETPDDLIWVCRSARLTRPAYRFYRDVLLWFAKRGRAPDSAVVAALARQYGLRLESTLAQFAALDLMRRDLATGAIRAAYPFSGPATAHRVRLAATSDEPEVDVFAMCAIDALGIPLMLRRAATIASADGLTGEPVRVTVTLDTASAGYHQHATAQWAPVEAVVFARPEDHEHEHDCGSDAAGSCCPVTNFFISEAHALMWAASSPHTDGHIYSQDDALRYAARLFGGVVDRLADPPQPPLT